MIYTVKGGGQDMGCYGSMCVPGRQFLTREEKLEMLKEYHEELTQEAKGVSERINQLEKE